MHISELPERTQDYLKILWNFEERAGEGESMPLGELAAAAGQKLPTASEAVKRLAGKKLVVHERYFGVSLTELGRELAVAVVRRHRLLETFLVQTLGYSWDEVHEEAEILEHACTDRFLSRIDAALGHPARDPHGDPIPGPDGAVEPLSGSFLVDSPAGRTVVMEQVDDSDGDLLRFLDVNGMHPGVELEVVSAPAAGLMQLKVGGKDVSIAEVAARGITVRE